MPVRSTCQEVLGDRGRSVGLVIDAVLQCDGHAVRTPRSPAVEPPAEEVEGADVGAESRKPRTGAVGLAPVNGVPVALTSISGKAVQPVAGTSFQRVSAPAECARRPPELTVSPLPSATLVKRRRFPAAATLQSAGGPGAVADETVSSGVAWGISPAGP
jgi:hypothetical protein